MAIVQRTAESKGSSGSFLQMGKNIQAERDHTAEEIIQNAGTIDSEIERLR